VERVDLSSPPPTGVKQVLIVVIELRPLHDKFPPGVSIRSPAVVRTSSGTILQPDALTSKLRVTVVGQQRESLT